VSEGERPTPGKRAREMESVKDGERSAQERERKDGQIRNK
jgi:hypothetical protein